MLVIRTAFLERLALEVVDRTAFTVRVDSIAKKRRKQKCQTSFANLFLFPDFEKISENQRSFNDPP